MQQPIEIFFSYAHEDEELMNDVRRQLTVYDRQNEIVKWYDRLILPGGEWAGEIDDRLRRARVTLLFVSPHFIESKYCYDVEMAEALRRHETGQTVVIPIILRPCPWRDSPIGQLQALPKDGRALTLWPNRDEVCLDVAEGVMGVVRRISSAGSTGTQTQQEVKKLHQEIELLLAHSKSGESKTVGELTSDQEGGRFTALQSNGGKVSIKWLVIRLIAITVLILSASVLLAELDILLADQLWVVQPIIAIYIGCELLLFGYFWKRMRG
jgi:hypothetical protein